MQFEFKKNDELDPKIRARLFSNLCSVLDDVPADNDSEDRLPDFCKKP